MNKMLHSIGVYLSGVYGFILYQIKISSLTEVIGALTALASLVYVIMTIYYKRKIYRCQLRRHERRR